MTHVHKYRFRDAKGKDIGVEDLSRDSTVEYDTTFDWENGINYDSPESVGAAIATALSGTPWYVDWDSAAYLGKGRLQRALIVRDRTVGESLASGWGLSPEDILALGYRIDEVFQYQLKEALAEERDRIIRLLTADHESFG